MPTNLPPEAKEKWAEVEAASNPSIKVRKMQEFLSCVPQHKGTMKLRGQVKKKIAVILKDMEDKKRKGTGKSTAGQRLFVEKEGAAQMALIGMTNVGKSSLLAAVTNAKVDVSPVPYTSHRPIPSIMNYQDIQFQIIEAPALVEGSSGGKTFGTLTIVSARNADCLILMVDLSTDPVYQIKTIIEELEKARILTSKPRGKVEIDRKHTGAALRIVLLGKLVNCSMREVETLLRSFRLTDAIVRISGEVTLEDIEESIFERTTYKPSVIIANKLDLPYAKENLKRLQEYVKGKIPIIALSSKTKVGLDLLGEALFKTSDVIRIYTKEPSMKKPSPRPFTLKKGAVLQDLAKNIHKDFLNDFAFAKVWAERLVHSPMKVGLGFELEDGDIIEMHTK